MSGSSAAGKPPATPDRTFLATWSAFLAALFASLAFVTYGLGSGLLIVTAGGIAIAIGSAILFIGAVLPAADPDHPTERIKGYLRDEQGFPSLSRVQFFTWTFVIFFSLLWVTFIRILNGEPAFSGSFATDVPANLLAIMGLSTATVVAGSGVKNPKTTQFALNKLAKEDLGWKAIIMEGGKGGKMHPSLGRLQMLGWTIISVAFFMGLLLVKVHQVWVSGSASSLGLPDLDPTLVTLMGISQVGYVGAKYVAALSASG